MTKKQDIIIHFTGTLNSSMVADLDSQIFKELLPDSNIIFHFSKLESVESDGARDLEILCMKIGNSMGNVVFSGLRHDFFGFCPEQLPGFSSIEDAKKFFQKNISEKTQGDTPSELNSKNQNTFVTCPACGTSLNTRGKGNYRCPLCRVHFFIHGNGRISIYEKLV
ncbi:MAG: hypothetical protein L6Q54_05960 [Leptospiraceae bacterium]|nr:hypothetical protein [Leptospiraceae bacterium]MCK6380780.1 hypothetical protein [Leptospiraceae bacterium]